MSHLFTMLGFSVNNTALPVLPASDYDLLVGYEPDSYDHWLLGPAAASLTGLKYGAVLTPAGTGHTFGSTSVTIPGDMANELSSPLAETADMTVCAVIKLPTLANGQGITLFGNAGSTDGFAANIAYSSVSGWYSLNKVVRGVTGLAVNNVTGVSAGQHLFIALSLSFSGATNTLISYVGSKVSATENPAAEKTPAAVNIALGNARYANANYNGNATEASEFILYNRALTAAELDGVYARSKTRMSKRGITVV